MQSEHWEERIRELEQLSAESSTYIKTILEDMTFIKGSIQEMHQLLLKQPVVTKDHWQPVIMELIKMASLSLAILGSIAGAIRIMGS